MHFISSATLLILNAQLGLLMPNNIELLSKETSIEESDLFDYLDRIISKDWVSSSNDDHPGNNGTIALIESAGYPAETHIVTTEDCYILQMHRIPHGKNEWGWNKSNKSKPVVFLQHGLLGCSDNWVLSYQKPTESLGYILADAGYDVWLGNYRGNDYSREHCTLDSEEMEFWDFSWDESAEYDLPAMINKVLETTQHDKIFYVGHSMGTTAFMAMVSTNSEMKEKIIMANLLSPVAYVEHMRSPVRLLVPYAERIKHIFDIFGWGVFPPPIPFPLIQVSENASSDKESNDNEDEKCQLDLIGITTGLAMGFDLEQCNKTMMKYAHLSTSSVRTIMQYAQEIESGRFCKYDYGASKNMEKYGHEDPPEYDIKNIDIPIATYWGDNDWLAEPTDVFHLTSQLPNLIKSQRVSWDKWNHLDYISAKDADILLYPEVLSNIEKFRN